MSDEALDAWVDEVLDEYERYQALPYPKERWSVYLQARPCGQRPLSISGFVPSAVQDALVWLHDGGMGQGCIATTLGITNHGVIGDSLKRLEDQYEDEDEP
jgi:hypothetical protein